MIGMHLKNCLICIGLSFITTLGFGQGEDPILFSIENMPVHVSEFNYIYTKTNRDSADFSRASVEEYLDLYVKFKLKVARAKEMQLDTIPTLSKELAGYRRQLADSYLINKEVTEKLVKEAYGRSTEDVDFSHILVRVSENATPADTTAAYQKILAAQKRIQEGEKTFGEMAVEISDDASAKRNKGRIGFLNVLFPAGFYPLEKAAYQLPIGTLSNPIRTRLGYHLLKVNDRRPARGEVEVAHILVRKNEQNPAAPKEKIQTIYQQLENGGDFKTVAKQYSEDLKTADKAGYLGFFGINKYSKDFEDAAFSLATDGAYSKPVETSIGWHIIQRISNRGIQPYEIDKRRLENLIKRDPRFEASKLAIIRDIKKEAPFIEKKAALESFIGQQNETFVSARWEPNKALNEEELFRLGNDFVVNLGHFQQFLRNAAGKRITYGRSGDLKQVANRLYEEFVLEKCFEYEEAHLEEKYPDFKSLMREYEEGILLFEATKMLVWDKAAQDSVGLNAFHKTIEGKYAWGPRAEITTYKIDDSAQKKLGAILSYMEKYPPNGVKEKFNSDGNEIIEGTSTIVERNNHMEVKEMEWREGALSTPKVDPTSQFKTVIKIERIIPPTNKTLEEAKGYIIADYQEHLEKEWVAELRKKVPGKHQSGGAQPNHQGVILPTTDDLG